MERLLMTNLVFVFLTGIICFSNVLVAATNTDEINSLLEGRYELVYWTENKIRFDYPEVAGVLILNDNNALITLNKNIIKNESVEVIGWGKYEINNNSFQIGWHDWKLLLI